MAGIVFFRTRDMEKVKKFYIDAVGMKVWLAQEDCLLLSHGNSFVGFCLRDECDSCGTITFFYRSRGEVDALYEAMQGCATGSPAENEKYRIYNFFARDPEGRSVEFQCFLHPLAPYLSGDELLVTRRSIREFSERDVPDETLLDVFERCRYAPTSRNSQSYYFVVVRDGEVRRALASLRGENSAPLGRAPLAVAVCADSQKSGAYLQDGVIAAYHFMLAAWLYGLGTCWICAMDRREVKEILGIPEAHYVATVTPLGYPEAFLGTPNRREAYEMVKYV